MAANQALVLMLEVTGRTEALCSSTCFVSLLRMIHSSPTHPRATNNAANTSTQPKNPNPERMRLRLLIICRGVSGFLIAIASIAVILMALVDYKLDAAQVCPIEDLYTFTQPSSTRPLPR